MKGQLVSDDWRDLLQLLFEMNSSKSSKQELFLISSDSNKFLNEICIIFWNNSLKIILYNMENIKIGSAVLQWD